MILRSRQVLRIAVALSLAPVACGGTASPEESEGSGESGEAGEAGGTGAGEGNDGEGGQARCTATETMFGLDEVSPLGFTVAEVLAFVVGERDTTLTFAHEPTTLRADLHDAVWPIRLELAHEGGAVKFVDREVDPEWQPDGEGGFEEECTDYATVELAATLDSDGGELAERRTAMLQISTADEATFSVDLLPPALSGTLDASTLFSDATTTALDFGGTLRSDGAAWGELWVEIRSLSDEPDGGWVGYGRLASWGEDPCPDELECDPGSTEGGDETGTTG